MTIFTFIFFGFIVGACGYIVLIMLMALGIINGNTGKDYRNYHQINAIRHNYDTRNEDVNWDLFKN